MNKILLPLIIIFAFFMNYIDEVKILGFVKNDPFNVFASHSLTPEDVINLCGGMPVKGYGAVMLTATSVSESAIDATVSLPSFEVIRRIDFALKRIDNASMDVHEKNCGIGTSLFMNQLKTARSAGFDSINTFAASPDAYRKDYVGYVFWGKMGFLMYDHNDIDQFEQWAQYNGFAGKKLGEVLLDPKGCENWKRDGFGWLGKFDCADNSESMRQLGNYLESKGLTELLNQA